MFIASVQSSSAPVSTHNGSVQKTGEQKGEDWIHTAEEISGYAIAFTVIAGTAVSLATTPLATYAISVGVGVFSSGMKVAVFVLPLIWHFSQVDEFFKQFFNQISDKLTLNHAYEWITQNSGSIIYAPFTEEWVFRVFLQQLLLQPIIEYVLPVLTVTLAGAELPLAVAVSIVATAILFGLVHLPDDQPYLRVFTVSISGILYGYLAYQYGIAASIVAHMTHNVCALGITEPMWNQIYKQNFIKKFFQENRYIEVDYDVGYGNTLGYFSEKTDWKEFHPLKWRAGLWAGAVPIGRPYKFAKRLADGTIEWEQGQNRCVTEESENGLSLNRNEIWALFFDRNEIHFA